MEKNKNLPAAWPHDKKILWIAIASGVLAALLLYVYLQGKKEPYGQLTPVFVAKGDLAKGEAFSENSIQQEYRPAAFVPANRVKPEELGYILGKQTVINLSAGQIIVWPYVHSEFNTASLSTGLNPQSQERAATITIDEVKGIGGHLQPNDRVDVIGIFTRPGGNSQSTTILTKTVLQCVTVVAVGSARTVDQRETALGGVPASVTLKVTLEEAHLLAYAESIGQIRLVLRNPDDLSIAPELTTDFPDFLGSRSIAIIRKPKPTSPDSTTVNYAN